MILEIGKRMLFIILGLFLLLFSLLMAWLSIAYLISGDATGLIYGLVSVLGLGGTSYLGYRTLKG